MVSRILVTGKGSNPIGGTRGRRMGGKPAGKKFVPAQAKKAFLDYIAAGYNINASCKRADRSRKTYEYWRKNDPEFARSVDSIMATRKVDNGTRTENRVASRALGFAQWREGYLGYPVFPHQQQWVDLLEGREPTGLHSTQHYEPSRPTRLVVNTFPNAGKSSTLTIDYVAYRICINPAIKVAIISKTLEMASDMVAGVKTRLTHPDHHRLISDFAPEGGFVATADEWSASRVRLAAADRDPADKDPTLQALGLGSQVYGKRLDLILVDDAIDGENAQHWRKQLTWLNGEVASRPGMSGRIIVIGTRIAPADLYFQLRDPNNFQSGKTPWSYLSQPALLEDAPDPKDWLTLWPRCTTSWWTEDDPCPCGTDDCRLGTDGTFPRFDGTHLSMVRDSVDQDTWNQKYMQLEVGGNSTFPGYAIQAAVNKGRRAGKDGGMYSVPHDDCYIIGSVDPATTGYAAILVGGVHRTTRKRYIYDAWNIKHPTPQELKNRIKAATIEYGVQEWRIEKTGLLTMFTQEFELNQWLTARGVRLTPHFCVDDATQALSRQGWTGCDDLRIGDEILTMNIETGLSEWKPVKDIYRGAYSGPMHQLKSRTMDALVTPDHSWAASTTTNSVVRMVKSHSLNTNSVLRLAAPNIEGIREIDDDLVELVGWAVTLGRPTMVNYHTDRAAREITGDGKSIPIEWITRLHPQQRELLLDTMISADGWTQGTTRYYRSDTPNLLDAFEMLCALSGRRTYREDNPGHVVIATSGASKASPGNRPVGIDWSGRIWCPSTDNGTFVARRGGKAYVTGNTGVNKYDVSFGVASMTPLFGVWQEFEDGDRKLISDPLVELPRPDDSAGIRALVDQLGYWTPELNPQRTACDLVMALWFFEVGARDKTKAGQRRIQRNFSGKTPPRDRAKAAVIHLDEYRQRAVT